MKVSKSKRQLAQLLIEAGVKQFPEWASWVAQDSDGGIRGHEGKPKWQIVNKYWWEGGESWLLCRSDRIANFHQTILSRADFDQLVDESAEQGNPDADGWIEWNGGECPVDGDLDVSVKFRSKGGIYTSKAKSWSWWRCGDGADIVAYRLHKPEQVEPQYCESVTHTIPESVTAPTLDQLLRDYRNAADFAATKQAEADEAAKMRDERWMAAQARACELGVHIRVELVVDAEMRESEPVITDWRDLRKGDVIWWSGDSNFSAGEYVVYDTEGCGYEGPYTILLEIGSCREWIDSYGEEWRFIRRP